MIKVLASLAMLLAASPAGAAAITYTGGTIGAVQPGGISFITDGTSRTIQLDETTRLSACFDNATGTSPLSSITDGSSNTINFGENQYLTLVVGKSLQRQPISNITDGSSNTIFFGEDNADERCFAGDTGIVDIGNAIVDGSSNTIIIGEGTRFDVCFRNVRLGSITDGSSNTIQFGELSSDPVCFSDVRLPAIAVNVPEPGTLALIGLGLVMLTGWRWKRRLALAAILIGIAGPAMAGLVATIQPVKLCNGITCNEPIFDADVLSEFWEREADITLVFLEPRLLIRPDFFTLTDRTLERFLTRNLIDQTVALDPSTGTPPPAKALDIYFSRASFFDIWGAAAFIGADYGWVTTNNIVGGPIEDRVAFQTQVMAHEIGHMLGLAHILNLANIMHPSGGSSLDTLDYELNDAQAAIARASPLLTEVPEPSTIALLGAGLLGAGLWRRARFPTST